MAESWFKLGRSDQGEALEVAASALGRPAHLLEKDIWVVWTLERLTVPVHEPKANDGAGQ